MLVRFTSSTAGEMIMFAQHVHTLFAIIGKEGTARGVFLKEQLPDALARLHRVVDEEKLEAKLAQMPSGDDESSQQNGDFVEDEELAKEIISLGRRAQPFIHFMELTLKEGGFILWEAEKDF